MKETQYIYALCLVGGNPFYVGRSNNVERRMKEHKRDAVSGTETKYQVIRDILAGGDAWEHVILAEVTSEDQHFEDFWVYSLLMDGYTLANMKMGDAAMAADHDAMNSMLGRKERYNDAKTFLTAREREVKEAAARAATARLNAKNKPKKDFGNPLTTLFSFEKPSERYVSPAFLQLAARRGKRR